MKYEYNIYNDKGYQVKELTEVTKECLDRNLENCKDMLKLYKTWETDYGNEILTAYWYKVIEGSIKGYSLFVWITKELN
jgi:hypothetical protein